MIEQSRNTTWIWYFAVLAAACVLYIATLAPDLVWQDQGDFQYQAALGNLSRPGDLIRVHPLYIVVAHAVGKIGLFSYAYAANLVNALATCLTIANVFLITMLLTRRPWPSVLAAASYALAHTTWFIGTQAQTYGMATAAISGAIALVISYTQTGGRWKLLLMGLVCGLGASVHMMSQIAFAVIMLWLVGRCIKRKESAATIAGVIICWIIGSSALWVAAAIEYKQNGSVMATLHSALVGRWGRAVFNIGKLGLLVKKSMLFFVLNFPTPLVLLVPAGIWYSFKRLSGIVAWLLIVITVLYFLFAVRYDVPNQNHFFMPMYMLVSVYIGLGFAFIFSRGIKWWAVVTALLLAAVPPTYAAIACYAGQHKIELGTHRHIPYRDSYSYYLIPWQQNQYGPRRMTAEMMEKLPPNAIVIADSTTIPPLLYVHQIEHARPDINVFELGESKEKILTAARSGSRLFTISDIKGYCPEWVKSEWMHPFDISQTEHIFEIVLPAD